jgi:lipid II:glycine glycyltransferase (peptidoglycan interpeptide bridge formation enzyme)
VWSQRFDKPARRSVRRAERAGLTVERDLTGRLTTTFYAVYRAWIEDRARASGMPRWAADRTVAGRREPIELFEALAAQLGEACRQWVAWYAGEPVAVNISLVGGAHAMTWRGFSRKELAAPLRANNLLQKLAIEDACSAGCRSYSMGQSGGVEGIERFKEGLGAIPRPAPEYQVERLPLTRLSEVRSHLRSSVTRALSPPRVHRG